MSLRGGIALRIALACLAVMSVAVAVIAVGVLIVGAQTFANLMVAGGETETAAADMFDRSIGSVFVAATVLGVGASLVLAAFLARRLTRPLKVVGEAAGRLAGGDYSARAPRLGPSELVSMADSFNQMAESLERQESVRRELIANFAHELRTPLTNLHGYLEALRDGVMQPNPEMFASLREEVERLQRLSSSLDTLADGGALAATADGAGVDLAAAVTAAVELARPSLERARLSVELAVAEILPARADPDRVAQVMANLLQNAARYAPAGGLVKVEARAAGDTALVSVSNTGEDIPGSDLSRLFDRFYRVEKSRAASLGGAGIGLAIVRHLVESEGGRVGAESSGGVTRFWFSLPYSPPLAGGVPRAAGGGGRGA